MKKPRVVTARDSEVFLRTLQEIGPEPFRKIPILWKPSKKGPIVRVSRGADIRVVVEINVKGKGIEELEGIVRRALKMAHEIHFDLTSAVGIGAGREKTDREGRSYQPTQSEKLESWVEGMEERIGEWEQVH
jgi:hypothetical protein